MRTWISRLRPSRPGVGRRPPTHRRLRLERLEDRVTPVVTNLNTMATFPTIQAAVNAANAGETLLADPGNYTEDVLINKSLTLEGAQHGIDPGAAQPPPSAQSILTGMGARAPIQIASGVNNVTIDGLTIESPSTGSGALSAGVYVSTAGSTGITIENNIIQDNTTGVAIGNSAVTVQNNLIQDNNAPGSGSGNGVTFVSTNSLTTSVSGNHFTGNNSAGVLIAPGRPVSNVTISGNVLTNSGGIVLFQASAVTVSGNIADNESGAAIYIGGGDSGVTVRGNSVTGVSAGNAALYIDNGLVPGLAPPNSNLTVTGNRFNVNDLGGAGVLVNDRATPGSAYIGTLILSGDQIDTSGSDRSILNQSTTPIDARGETFNGVAAATATTTQLFAIQDTVVDAIDVSGFGLVRLKAGNVYVTPSSFFPPSTTTPSIQRAIDAATAVIVGPGGTNVNILAGPYNEQVQVPKLVNFAVDATGRVFLTQPGAIQVGGPDGQRQLVMAYTGLVGSLFLDNAAAVNAVYGPNTADRDAALAGLTPDERFVQVLYLNALGRPGSRAEIDGWAAMFGSGTQAQAQTAIATGIEHSPEARDHLVKSWYVNYLGRPAQNGEEQWAVGLLLQGQTEEQVLSQLVASTEFFDRAQTLGFGDTPDGNYVRALYQLLLGRSASPAEVGGWENGVLSGAGRAGVALGFLTSSEFRTHQFEGYYNALLHRPADATEINSWVMNPFDMGTTRILFETSPEFFANG